VEKNVLSALWGKSGKHRRSQSKRRNKQQLLQLLCLAKGKNVKSPSHNLTKRAAMQFLCLFNLKKEKITILSALPVLKCISDLFFFRKCHIYSDGSGSPVGSSTHLMKSSVAVKQI